MKKQSYFSFGNFNHENNVEQTNRPLVLNCTGYEVLNNTENRIGFRADYYCMMVAQGAMHLVIDRRGTTLREGRIILIPPRTPYRYTVSGSEGCEYYWMHITGSRANELINELGLPLAEGTAVENQERFALLFKQLFELYQNQDDLFRIESEGLLMRMLATMARNPRSSHALERSVLYMHRHYAEPLSVEDLAKMEAKSVSQYRKDFVARFGRSPKQYLIDLRLSVACHLLKVTNGKVEQIAQQCGYNDAHYFCRLFRRQIGCTPTDYRN